MKPVRVAVIGSGIISDIYLKNMTQRFDILDVRALGSAHIENARRPEQYGLPARTVDEILADPDIEMIVNLTPASVHEEIIRRALEAGKHVYTEKTLTAGYPSAKALCALAAEKGLWLGSAPDTFMGAALQTARRAIDDGLIGEVTSFAFAANRDNRVLTSFFTFLNKPGGGCGYDYAVYYLTALVALLGPVAQTAAMVRAPWPRHTDINPDSPTFGREIDTPNESEISAVLRLESGVCGTAHLNCDSVLKDQAFFAIYGTDGILYLPDPNGFGGDVRLLPAGKGWESEPERVLESRFGYAENSRGVGPADMALAIREGRPCRACADMACHVLEVIDRIMESSADGRFMDVGSTCRRPAPMGEDSRF